MPKQTYAEYVAQEFKKVEGQPDMEKYLVDNLKLDKSYVAPTDDDRMLNVRALAIEFKDSKIPEQVLPLGTDAERKAAPNTTLTIPQGSDFRLRLEFRAQHYILHDFAMHSTVKKFGKKVADDTEKLGSYNPSVAFDTKFLPRNGYNTAPSGMLARGTYTSKVVFASSDAEDGLLTITYKTQITK